MKEITMLRSRTPSPRHDGHVINDIEWFLSSISIYRIRSTRLIYMQYDTLKKIPLHSSKMILEAFRGFQNLYLFHT